jgi:hypothetical protein
MLHLAEFGRKPMHVVADEHHGPWFAELAARLVNACDFIVSGQRYRFTEVEAYYFSADHPDPYAHRDPLQREYARWYFHRTGGTYRGGSFKGLDLTFGDGAAYFGFLIRGIAAFDGTLFDGPCVTVNQILACTGSADVAGLDCLLVGRDLWDSAAPLSITPAREPRSAPVYASARVGLTLKRAATRPGALHFHERPYRYLTEPKSIAKGRRNLILSLYRTGYSNAAIHSITGSSMTMIQRISALEEHSL